MKSQRVTKIKKDSTAGNHGDLYQISHQSISYLLRYFSLDQLSGGQTNQQADVKKHWFIWALEICINIQHSRVKYTGHASNIINV